MAHRSQKMALRNWRDPTLSRRHFLKGCGSALITAAGWVTLPRFSKSEALFDFYVSPNGAESNLGTRDSPWSLSAINNKASMIAGRRVGLLDGNYDLSGFVRGWRQTPCIQVPSGTYQSPTVVAAVNARKAVLVLKASNGTRVDRPAIGQEGSGNGHVHVAGLTVNGGSYCGTSFHYTTAYAGKNIVVSDCEIFDIARGDSDNTVGAWFQGTDQAIVRNCYLHDIRNGGTANATGVMLYGANHTLIEQCTVERSHTAVFDKTSAGLSEPCQGTVVRRNYFVETRRALHGFDNAYGKAPPYDDYLVHNNVFESFEDAIAVMDPDIYDGLHIRSPVRFFNNTLVARSFSNGGCNLFSETGRLVSFFNNIIARTGSVGWLQDVNFGSGGLLILDYNCYPSRSARWGLDAKAVYTDLASWQSITGMDRSSICADPGFVGGEGRSAARFRLTSSSPCQGAGRVGGVASGSPTSLGAWTDEVSSVGHAFSAIAAPEPPSITVE